MQAVPTAETTSTEFLSLAKHDLMAKLRTIGTLATFVREDLGDASSDTARHLDMLVERTADMEGLISSLIEFEQAAQPGARPTERLQMREVLDDLWASIDQTGGIDLVVDLSPMNCLADTRALAKCLEHLIRNAVEHRRRRRGLVRVSAKPVQDFVEISIDDDGVGFPMEHAAIACEPLRKLSYKGRTADGNGLGLAIANRLVESHRGELQIHSREGSGTSLRVRWPITPAPEAVSDAGTIIWVD